MFKPHERCISKQHVFQVKTRLGMSVSETDDSICVELDSSSALTSYKEYIEKFDGTPDSLEFEISSILHRGT
jgi:hypothetical protein